MLIYWTNMQHRTKNFRSGLEQVWKLPGPVSFQRAVLSYFFYPAATTTSIQISGAYHVDLVELFIGQSNYHTYTTYGIYTVWVSVTSYCTLNFELINHRTEAVESMCVIERNIMFIGVGRLFVCTRQSQ